MHMTLIGMGKFVNDGLFDIKSDNQLLYMNISLAITKLPININLIAAF